MVRESRSYGDRGAEATEWGAAMLVVAAIVAVLIGPVLPQSIQDGIAAAICRVANFSDVGQCRPQQLKPDKCVVQTATQGYGLTLDVAIVRIGKDLEFMQVRDSNGAVTVIATNGATLGLVKGVGKDFQWGGVKARVGAEASASIHASEGDGWTFPNQAAADQFIEDIRQEGVRDAIDDFGPIGWLGRQVMDIVDPLELPPPTSTRYEIDLKAGAGASAGASVGLPPSRPGEPDIDVPDKLKPKADIGVGLEVGAKATVEHNHTDGSTSVTQEVRGSGRANANYVVGGKGISGEVRGSVQTTYDREGRLTKVTLTRSVTRDNRTVSTTTELPITTEAQRRAAYAQLSGRAQLDAGRLPVATHLNLTWDDFAPTTAPGAGATAFERLLYERGRTSQVTYEYKPDDNNYGGRVALGAQVGANVNIDNRLLTVQDAQYLGAPGPGGRREWADFEECRV